MSPIDWSAPIDHPDEVEDAVVRVMTYLVENENAALVVPTRFIASMHPHFPVFDALVVLAAGSFAPEALATGWDRVGQLQADMHRGWQARLRRLGFPEAEAQALSALHTRNFM